MDKKLTNIIAATITFIWALSFFADVIIKSYNPSPYVHMIMMTVAGAAFGQSIINKKVDK